MKRWWREVCGDGAAFPQESLAVPDTWLEAHNPRRQHTLALAALRQSMALANGVLSHSLHDRRFSLHDRSNGLDVLV